MTTKTSRTVRKQAARLPKADGHALLAFFDELKSQPASDEFVPPRGDSMPGLKLVSGKAQPQGPTRAKRKRS